MFLNQKPIDSFVFQIEDHIRKNPELKKELSIELNQLNRKVFSTSITQQNQGWCIIYKIPQNEILEFATTKFGIDLAALKKAFVTQWNIPNAETSPLYMYGNNFYHVLLLFIIYALRNNEEQIAKNSLILFCCKIWNGRRQKHIKICNPEIMRYVVANASGKKYVKLYDSPLSMITQKLVPNLLDKYGHDVKNDSTKSINFLNQAHNRIRQLFIQTATPNLKTGRVEATKGLAVEYFDAYKKGLKISDIKISTNDELSNLNQSSINNYSGHIYEELINNIVNYIVMNIEPKYDQNIINFINVNTTTRPIHIEIILKNLHNISYEDYIHDLISLLFRQLQITDKNDVCNPIFLTDTVKKKIISSKHTTNIVQLKSILDRLLDIIFREKIGYRDYNIYSSPSKGKLRNVVIYGLCYNIQKFICSSSNFRKVQI